MQSNKPIQSVAATVCEAIRGKHLLEFSYHGRSRVVAPYCHGVSTRGVEVLRAVQIRGESASRGFGFGKLWAVPEMQDVRVLEERFLPDDPDYNPNDTAMTTIHCRV